MIQFSQEYEAIRKIVVDPGCFATTLYTIALKVFGSEIHEWEPEMFDMEFRDEFQVELPKVNQSKLVALVTAIVSNRFYQDFLPFTVTCEVLNGGEENFQNITPDLLPAEIAWAVTEVRLNDDDHPAFDDEIEAYVGVILYENGFSSAPRPLEFAKIPQRYLGSSSGTDVGQMESQQTLHSKLVDQYLRDQSSALFDQLSALPWIDDDLMEEVVGEINRTAFRGRVIPEPAV